MSEIGGASPSGLHELRAFAAIDQRWLAERSGLTVPTIQRKDASDGAVRGNVDSLVKLIETLDAAGIELIITSAEALRQHAECG